MQVVCERCCGLDVHKKMVVACLLLLESNGQRHKEIRTFRTTTGELLQLADWLVASHCTHVAVEAAHGAAHKKNTYFSVLYRRIATRRGKQKATLAVAHTILVIGYHLLTKKKPYEELGENYFDERERQLTEKRLVRRLERLGYQVELQPVA